MLVDYKKNNELPNKNGISAENAIQAVKTLLQYIGENPSREGLLETPQRVCRAFLEMTEGYSQNPHEILSTTFHADTNEMILLKDIDYVSCCEHHLLTFTGKVHIAYIPSRNKIVGLSKLARIVDVFARRLQVQERLTEQIAQSIQKVLQPLGVAVVVEGKHSCMCVRGARKQNSTMVTSSWLGQFQTTPASRNEFLTLLKN
ncbi:MAG: GTP cyclohydrolase I FolE [Silvanigrellaceae bacterium]|nr:GTP cyclohydrolase I FolE [Silvanigrellaceae bacterium]